MSGGQFARFPGIQGSFASHPGLHLPPGQIRKRLRHPGALHNGMAHIDVELESDRELVIHQPRGDEHALRVAQVQVAVTNGVVAECDVVPIGNYSIVALAHCKRNKIVGLALQSCRRGTRNGGNHPLQIRLG